MLQWVNVAEIETRADNTFYYDGMPVSVGSIAEFNNGLRFLRDAELGQRSGGRVNYRGNLGAWTTRRYSERSQHIVTGGFGEEARIRHRQDISFAETVAKSSMGSAEIKR